MTPTDNSRRRFLQLAVTGAACLSMGNSLSAWAAAPRLSPDDPQAKALGYIEDAAKLSTAKEPAFKKGSVCSGCALYDAAKAEAGFAPCLAFSGKAVNAKGWCRAFAPKA
jgi:anaerobic selenocysteine-containing dehydrogenase